MPSWYGSPSTAHMRSLNKVGTPRNGPSGSAAATSSRASSKRGWMTALSSWLSFSMRLIAASTSSTGDSCPVRTSSAWAVASRNARSSVIWGTLRPRARAGPASAGRRLARAPAQQRDRDVVAEAAGREGRDLVDTAFDDRVGLVGRRPADEVGEALDAELVAGRVANLDEPVGVYGEHVAGIEPGRGVLPRPDEGSDDRPGRFQLGRVRGRAQERRWVTGARIRDVAGREVDNGDEGGEERLVAEVVELLRGPQHRFVGVEAVPEAGSQQLLAAQGQDPRDGAVPGDVDDDQTEARRRELDHVVAVAGDDALSWLELRGDAPAVGKLLDTCTELGAQLEHDGRALLDGLAGAHGVVERAVHLETHGVYVAGEVRDLRRALRRYDAHLAAARASNRARETFDRTRHPIADEERGRERRRRREAEDDADRRVELDSQVLETVLCRAQVVLLGVVQRSGGDERALILDDVVTLGADAEHQRRAREDDDEIRE